MNRSTEEKFTYKIQRKSDGLYSTGGSSPGFTRRGKTWSSIGALKGHLGLFIYSRGAREHNIKSPYSEDCVIVTYQQVIVLEPKYVKTVDKEIEEMCANRDEEERKYLAKKQKELEDHLASCPYKTLNEARGQEVLQGSYSSYPSAPCKDWYRFHNTPFN